MSSHQPTAPLRTTWIWLVRSNLPRPFINHYKSWIKPCGKPDSRILLTSILQTNHLSPSSFVHGRARKVPPIFCKNKSSTHRTRVLRIQTLNHRFHSSPLPRFNNHRTPFGSSFCVQTRHLSLFMRISDDGMNLTARERHRGGFFRRRRWVFCCCVWVWRHILGCSLNPFFDDWRPSHSCHTHP